MSVDKKNQLDVTFCILYFSSNSCSACFGQPCSHHRSWRLRDVIALCWYVSWLQGGCQVRLAVDVTFYILYLSSNSCSTCFGQPCAIIRSWRLRDVRRQIKNAKVLTTFPQPRHIPTRGYNITQSSAPDDGTWLPETCWAASRREIKNTKVTSIWFFLSTLKQGVSLIEIKFSVV